MRGLKEADFLRVVRETIARHRMLSGGERVVVAVSGGPDSLALLYVLWSLRTELSLELHVAHLNHLLRGGDAHEDARFVRGVANQLGLEATVEETDVAALAREEGLSLEEAGRLARYEFLHRVMARTGAARAALGHNRDDQAETVLMRLVRGTGPAGLAGILPVRPDGVIRPLITCSRRDIEAYLREVGLTPRMDATNEDKTFLRNRVRLDVLPRLEEINPNLRQSLANLAETMRAEEEWLEQVVAEAAAKAIREEGEERVLILPALAGYPPALRRRLVRRAVGVLAGNESSLTFEHGEQVLALLERAPGQALSLPGGVTARREHDAVVLTRTAGRAQPFLYMLPVPGEVAVPEAGLRLQVRVEEGDGVVPEGGPVRAVFDADRIPVPLIVRSRRKGDRIRPAGGKGTKKLKEYFIDKKVPRRRRDQVPILAAGEEILWVVGGTKGERFLPGPATRRYLIVTASDL